tara:strand:+ start:326 stop:541 length:216 start_codon:yes stop_codon:yes gene_type:complete
MYNTFVLTLNEENINISLLFELKKIFLSYPGDEKVCLKIIEKNTGNFKFLELVSLKVNPSISMFTEILYKI